jgi:hypothetical protein
LDRLVHECERYSYLTTSRLDDALTTNFEGNEYFCDIDEDYIQDRFNLTGLQVEVENYKEALEMITETLGKQLPLNDRTVYPLREFL